MFLAKFQALLQAHRCCLSVSSWDRSSNFIAWWLRWWGCLTCIFSSDGLIFSRVLAWRSIDLVNRILRIGSKTFCIGFPRDCLPLWETSSSESCETEPICGTIFTIATALLSSLSLLLWKWSPFFGFLFGCSSTLWRGNKHSSPASQRVSVLVNWQSGGCQYSQDVRVQVPLKQYLHGCRRMAPWLLLPRIHRFLNTLRPRDSVSSESVAASGPGFCARALLSCPKLLWSPFAYWLFLSTGDRYLFLLQRHSFPFDSWPLLLIQFSRVWRQCFEVEVSDLFSSSPLSWHAVLRWSCMQCEWTNEERMTHMRQSNREGASSSHLVRTFALFSVKGSAQTYCRRMVAYYEDSEWSLITSVMCPCL